MQEIQDQIEEVEFNNPDFCALDELQNNGINAADITKLRSAGSTSVKAVLMTHSRILLKIKGLSDAKGIHSLT